MAGFKTIAHPSEGFYKEKGSKFLSFVYPVSSEDEASAALDQLKKKYHDARHHCYAYIIDPRDTRCRVNDDGEPNHSAGDPILGQLKSFELINVLCVVVRYFGGTKLGVGGLINAYKEAAFDALQSADIIKKKTSTPFVLTYEYSSTSEVQKIIDELSIAIKDQEFTEKCTLEGLIDDDLKSRLNARIELMKNLGHHVRFDIL